MKALELADFILASYPEKDITPMKLQKLAFYSKAWTLVAGHSFVEASFEKWDYGPVNPELYQNYKKYGSAAIPAPVKKAKTQKNFAELLKFILNNYIDYSAFTLSSMTHNEDPWVKTPSNEIISNEIIVNYYSQQPFAKNFQDTAGQPFHVLQSNNWHSFTLDMDDEETESFATYSSFEEFHKHSNEASLEFQALLKDIDDLL